MTTVAIQGIRGSYSEEAALRMLGASADLIECCDFASTFEAVTAKRATHAVIPLRNKIVGEIGAVADLLAQTELTVLEELDLDIRHVLAGTATAEIGDVITVRSHIEALKQCSSFLAANPHIRQITGDDTASSISQIAGEDKKQNAAIGSARAAKIYGATILRKDIANDLNNWTTFGLIGQQ